MDSAFDLAWDHEMDLNIFNTEVRRPYNKHVPQCNISPDFDNESHTNQFATRSRLFDAKKKSMTAVSIHDSSFSQTPSVTILPVRNDNLNADNRWVSSDRLPGNARSTTKKPITSETAIPCSDLFVSPTYNVDLEYSTTSKVTPRLAFHDNLFDSGFVGGSGGSNMISSFSDFDDTDEKVIGVDKREPADNLTTDLPTDHSNDFLWEHELFIPPMCCKTKEVRCPTTV
ncbi:hypothetical protein KSF78_0003069 [Schistosoma japonicum]|nr:hypothetical protein KSF78_0003069 [Schistosoma japonicum]